MGKDEERGMRDEGSGKRERKGKTEEERGKSADLPSQTQRTTPTLHRSPCRPPSFRARCVELARPRNVSTGRRMASASAGRAGLT
eukprot:1173587-Rhodomonas_salina.1